jgi:5-methyltetrahydrofolate--homocysteine methyltransferase
LFAWSSTIFDSDDLQPKAHYFGVGKIERDQVAAYARRKGWDLATAERWLAPILNYEPTRAAAA